jgi:putative aldouronate transport system substrate-binding protein
VPGAVFIPIDPFKNEQGITYKRGYDPIGYHVFMPKSAKYPELVIDYMAWQTNPDVQFMLLFGKEGIQFEGRDADGIPYGRKTNDQLASEDKSPGATDICVVINGTDYGSQELNDQAKIVANPKYGQYWIEADRIAVTNMFTNPPITTPIKSQGTLGTTVRAKGNELFVRSIMATPAQFDQTFDAFLEEYKETGATEIMEERKAAWAKEHP